MRKFPDVALEIAVLESREDIIRETHKTIESRKYGLTGSRAVRGTIAGQLLRYMATAEPESQTLTKAYRQWQNNFQSKKIKRPSNSLLKTIWGEFVTVAPFWAASDDLQGRHGESLWYQSGRQKFYIKEFLSLSYHYRSFLVELKTPSTGAYLVKNPFSIWKIERQKDQSSKEK